MLERFVYSVLLTMCLWGFAYWSDTNKVKPVQGQHLYYDHFLELVNDRVSEETR